MKAEELMLGDWVLQCDDYTQVVPWTIKGMLREEVIANGIKPIPITHEILEKNGFKMFIHNCSCYYDWSNSDSDDVTLKRYPCGYFELHITDNENLRNIRFPIDYVHELQHALKLCKIDKEIEL